MKIHHILAIILCLNWPVLSQAPDKPAKATSRCGKVVKTYYKSNNATHVQLMPYILEGAFQIDKESGVMRNGYQMYDWGFSITFLYSHQGKDYSKPLNIEFFALYEGQYFRYETERSLAFDLKTEIIDLGSAKRTTEQPMTGRLREQLTANVSLGQLSTIAAAEHIKLNAGRDSFVLTPCQIEGIRKFANTLQ